ncbi:MAG: glycoside hydrolase family 32 protein [Aquaticitalea sp.]
MNTSEESLYRPNFHFTPSKGWMNDPNGMFYLNGKYHLYFQYYPKDNVWGPMHWGHATSEDLIVWKEQPIALFPDALGYIFSGSAIVDIDNTAGFAKDGKTAVVAIFTYHNIEGEKAGKIDFQSQGIAYSLDEGQTWTKYKGNPVLPNPGIKDFRDPKVVWDAKHKQWLMALATYEKTIFYTSTNLKNWALLSDFGEGLGAHEGVWECPDFFPMQVEGTDETKWVLIQSINPGHINGGSGTQYFVGDFDGKTFVLDTLFAQQLSKQEAIWLDYGKDNYAGVTWSNIPKDDGRKLFMAWMSNWEYAQVVPTTTWRSAMTLARNLKLTREADGYFLISEPVKEFESYKKMVKENKDIEFSDTYTIIDENEMDINKAMIELHLSNLKEDTYNFVLSNSNGEELQFGINNKAHYYFIDRRKSGDISFSDKFAEKISTANYGNSKNDVSIQIIIDKTSVEIFYDQGKTVMTELFFPTAPMQNLKLNTVNHSRASIDTLVISELKI